MQQPTASVQRGGKSKRSSGGGHGTSRGSTGKGRGGPGASSSSSSSSTCPTAVGMASVLGPSSDSFGCDDCSASEGTYLVIQRQRRRWRIGAGLRALRSCRQSSAVTLRSLSGWTTCPAALLIMLSGMIRAFLVDMSPGQDVCVEEQTGGLGTSLLFSQRGAAEISLHMGVCVVATSTKARILGDSNAKRIYRLEPHRKQDY